MKPKEVKLKPVMLLRNGGLLLELNSPETVQWLRNTNITDKFLGGIGSGASIKNKTYQVIISFTPIQFNPEEDKQVRAYEEHNNIQQNSIHWGQTLTYPGFPL